jgi:hypothetical protein
MAMGYKPVCESYIEHVFTNRKKNIHIFFYKTLNSKFVIHTKERDKKKKRSKT